jgi:hypothetical protein
MAVQTVCAAFGNMARTTGSEISGAPGASAMGKAAWFDTVYGGGASITGTTKIQTGPSTILPYGNCLVWIMDQRSGLMVRTLYSDAGGNFTVPSVNPGKSYLAIAFDPAGIYDVVATRDLQVAT